MNTISKLIQNQRQIVITHPSGVMKPEVPKHVWQNISLKLKQGEEIERDSLLRRLTDMGYTREYIVEKPGDFSLRGGIVDIFLFNQKYPIRIDFFGDEMDEIKYFEIDSQRSFEEIKEIQVMPFSEFIYTEKEYQILEEKILDIIEEIELSDEGKNRVLKDLENLKNHQELDRLSRYISILYEKKSTILDYIDSPNVLLFDAYRTEEQVRILIKELENWYEDTGDYTRVGFELVHSYELVYQHLFIKFDYFDYHNVNKGETVFYLFGKDVLSYHSNFDLFLSDIQSDINRTTLVLAISTDSRYNEIRSLLIENKIPYEQLSTDSNLAVDKINLVHSDQYFDVISDVLKLHVITENAIYRLKNFKRKGRYISVYEQSKRLSSVNDLHPGDYVVHYDYGIGKFIEVKTMVLGQTKNDYILLEYRDGDNLYIPLESFHQIQKYAGSEGYTPRLSKLGGSDWSKTKQRVRQKAEAIADQLIKLYSNREHSDGYAFKEYAELEQDFIDRFPYEETKDQDKAIRDVLIDMSKPRPMDRLLCGDVGFGKTEVALRAAFRAVLNEKQVAYLAPTTVLSNQHFHTFKDRMESFGIQVELLNRFITKAKQKSILERLKQGKIDVVIGTHRILSKDIEFKDLGLLVIDEEQRFGVLHKERIKEMKVNVDVLSLSATPIPRTLQMAIMGVKNMSLLETAPENRYPIQTYVIERNDILIKDAIERELLRHGQIFYLYNRIDDIDIIASKIQKLVPEAKIAVIHGKMHKHTLEDVVEAFINREIDVLISTTIIETGIDIPNANTLIIHEADQLGLSQLYQIRGRVGRSDRIAYAYLMYQKNKTLTEDAEKRLKVIKEFTELGSGFKIAIRDLSIRGAGDILGSEQSGFIDSVGIDLYMRILEEEVKIKQGEKVEQLSKQGVKAQVSKYIDEAYIEDDFVKIEMHKKIQEIQNKKDIDELAKELRDRFGQVEDTIILYMTERLFEVQTKKLDIEKIIESKTNITLIASEASTKKLAGDTIFKAGFAVSPYLRFAYKKERIHFILDTIELQKHWLYTMVDFLDLLLSKMEPSEI